MNPLRLRTAWAFAALWRFATSPATFVVLSLLWCVDLGIGSLLAWRADPQFWMKMDAYPFGVWLRQVAPKLLPLSSWVYVLVGLTYMVVLSLVLCTLHWFFRRRKRARGMGEVLIHLGFLLVFLGFVLGSSSGARSQGIRVEEGATAEVPGQDLRVRMDRIEVVRGRDGQPLDTVSRVALLDATGEITSGTVRTNHPLIRGTTVVYPGGAQVQVLGVRLDAGEAGVITIRTGESAALPGGRSLAIRGILQADQRYGPWLGPGALVLLSESGGAPLASGYVSPAPNMARSADLAGTRVRLLDLIEGTQGIYDVHRDPGIQLVLLGAVTLALGTLWALAGYLGLRFARVA